MRARAVFLPIRTCRVSQRERYISNVLGGDLHVVVRRERRGAKKNKKNYNVLDEATVLKFVETRFNPQLIDE